MNSNFKQFFINGSLLFIIVLFSLYLNYDFEKTFMFMGGSYLSSSFTKVPFERLLKIINKCLPGYLLNYEKYFELYDKFLKYKNSNKNLTERTKQIIEKNFEYCFDEINNDTIEIVLVNKKVVSFVSIIEKIDKIEINENEKQIIQEMFKILDNAYDMYNDENILAAYRSSIESGINILSLNKKCNKDQIRILNNLQKSFLYFINRWNNEKLKSNEFLLYTIDTFLLLNNIEDYENEIYKEIITDYIEQYSDYFIEENLLKNIKIEISVLMTLYKKNNSIINIEEKVNKLDKFLDFYDVSLKKTIISDILIQFIGNISLNKKSEIKPLFLFGSHGTGKTKFVQELSTILDSHLYYFNDTNENQTKCMDKIEEKEYSIFTKAVYETKLSKKHSCIIFIDEFDKYFNNINNTNNINISKYLTLLNTEKLKDGKIIIPDINILFIASGNKLLKDISSVLIPLHDRFITISFPKIDKTLKKKIIYDKFNLKDEDKKINEFIEKDNNDGIRELVNKVSNYIERKKTIKIFEETLWKNY